MGGYDSPSDYRDSTDLMGAGIELEHLGRRKCNSFMVPATRL